MENLRYTTPELEKYFSRHRIQWDQFYESERAVLDKIAPAPSSTVLDIGCGCGGLGLALRERFGISSYTGIEINSEAAESARILNPEARIVCGDFLKASPEALGRGSFDCVVSLSCIDWNIAFEEMLGRAWSLVREGGVFIASLRLTTGAGVNDVKRSYQYINYDGHMEGEIAPYVVLNGAELVQKLKKLGAHNLYGYGYYGAPGKTAVTPFRELCFVVLSARKEPETTAGSLELQVPGDIESMFREAWQSVS